MVRSMVQRRKTRLQHSTRHQLYVLNRLLHQQGMLTPEFFRYKFIKQEDEWDEIELKMCIKPFNPKDQQKMINKMWLYYNLESTTGA